MGSNFCMYYYLHRESFRTFSDDAESAQVSPLLHNVIFASSRYNICFSLESFANLYADHYGQCFIVSY